MWLFSICKNTHDRLPLFREIKKVAFIVRLLLHAMKKICLGLLRETKFPPEKRVAFTPAQCHTLQASGQYDVWVQPYPNRCFSDAEYRKEGIELREDLSSCDYLFGIKEVQPEAILPGKTYFIFSHTIKKQPHNRRLLQTFIQKGCTLIDYECLRDISGQRILGFGFHAGLVGAYNAIRAYGLRYGIFDLKPAYQCRDYEEMKKYLAAVKLPPVKILITGDGRVAHGVVELLEELNIKKVGETAFLTREFFEPVFCKINYDTYYMHKGGRAFDKAHFREHSEEYVSDFFRFARVSDILITGHYWDARSPVLFTVEEMQNPDFKIKVVADITCDIGGSVPCTIRASEIEKPFYGFNPFTGKETPPFDEMSVTVMAVDNLPCEIPRDASHYFGNELSVKVLPLLLGEDPFRLIEKATIVKEGCLTPAYAYLEEYAHLPEAF